MRYKNLASALVCALVSFLVVSSASAQDQQTASIKHTPQGGASDLVVYKAKVHNGIPVTGNAITLNHNGRLDAIWQSRRFSCNNGSVPSSLMADFTVPEGAVVFCARPDGRDPNHDPAVVAVVASLNAPANGTYRFAHVGGQGGTYTVSTLAPPATEEYVNDTVDTAIEESGGRGRNCCDLAGFGTFSPDMADATSSMSAGGGVSFATRPHPWVGLGITWRYEYQDVWLEPTLQDDWTDNDHPEHRNWLLARGGLSIPAVKDGNREWLRLDVMVEAGALIAHYAAMAWKQYETAPYQVRNVNNETVGAFVVGPYAGLNFYPHPNVLIMAAMSAPVNVNGLNRVREDVGGVASREEPPAGDGHWMFWTPIVGVGGSF
jgi:hypothetical protein